MAWREKRWQFVAVVADEAIVAGAVANLGYMGFGFAYLYDRQAGRGRREDALTPLGLGAVVAERPDQEVSRLSLPNVLVRHDPQAGLLEVRGGGFWAELALEPAAPFDAGWEIPGGGPHRTRKRMGGTAHGRVCLDGQERELQGQVLYDWSRGQPARETSWRWAAGAGRCGSRPIAWNLRTGFDDPAQVENVLWLDGVPRPLGAVTIEPGERWHLAGGGLELSFEPDGEEAEDLDYGLVASRYRQPWGRFRGVWEGQPLEAYGVVEDHWARW
jgi:hypothetical protein